MYRRLPAALSLLLVAPLFLAHADQPTASLRVFYTGHSFHMFVPRYLTPLAKAAGITQYQNTGAQGLGGSRVDQHWNLPDEKNQAKKALEKGDVDIFTMAPNVKIPDEGIDRFVELGLKHNPKMRFLVQMSWLPGDSLEKRVTNNAQRDEIDLAKLGSEQDKWRGQIEDQVKAINQKVGRDAVHIVPAGNAVLRLRQLIAAGKLPGIAKQSDLFTDVIGHGKAPLLYLVSCCNYACITGRSPVGLKVPDAGLSDELQAALQKIAWETVTSYPMSGVKTGK